MSNLKEKAATFVRRSSIKVKKYSPEIFLGIGIASGVGAVVAAYNTKPKIDEILDESAEKKEKVAEYLEENGYTEEYTQEDHSKDLTIIFTQTAVKIAREFLPVIGLGTLSITCILASHNVLKKRNAALAAAYEIANHTFRTYRDRVIEKFGDEVDKELTFGVREVEHSEKVVDKDGKEKVKKTKEVVVEGPCPGLSSNARCFDSSCFDWHKEPEYNMIFIQQQMRNANDKLIRDGYLFLNDVYEMLGFERSRAGQVLGWVYDPEGTRHGKHWPKDQPWDNYIDFGIFNINSEANRRFVNNLEPCIWLDFNVDGNILDLIN